MRQLRVRPPEPQRFARFPTRVDNQPHTFDVFQRSSSEPGTENEETQLHRSIDAERLDVVGESEKVEKAILVSIPFNARYVGTDVESDGYDMGMERVAFDGVDEGEEVAFAHGDIFVEIPSDEGNEGFGQRME